MPAPCWSRRPGRRCAGPGRCGPSTSASPAPGQPHRRRRGRPQARGHRLAPAPARRRLRLGAAGAARQEAAGPGAALRAAGAPRPARDGPRLQPGPNAPGGKAQGRAGRDRLSAPDRGLDPAGPEGAHGRRKGGATPRLRGRAFPSHPALCRAVTHGQPENSTRSRKNDWSTSSGGAASGAGWGGT